MQKIWCITGEDKIIFSARHLYSSGENLLAIFFDGTLKVNECHTGIKNLIKERNTIKGKEFRLEVKNWMKKNTDLFVLEYEFNINTKIADKNYGDIDILALDDKKKILFSIECKNTKQAKIIYDFWKDVKNYTDRQIPKHLRRGKWLKDNLELVSQKINKDLKGYEVKSVLISSSVLPVKFTKDYKEIEFSSFSQLIVNNIFLK